MYRDNLARKIARPQSGKGREGQSQKQTRARVLPRLTPEKRRYLEERERYAQQNKQRRHRLGQIVAFLGGLTAMAIFLLYVQSLIISDNYANQDLRQEIARLEQENSQLQSEIALKSGRKEISEQAIALGFQEAEPEQIVRYRLPKSDQLLLSSVSGGQGRQETYSEILDSLEDYFRTAGQQNP